MLLIIDYLDGTSEQLKAELVGDVVSYYQGWIPGILVAEPKRCFLKSDFFEAALNEGHLRSRGVEADPEEPDYVGFRWRLVGHEADACREKLAEWMTYLARPSIRKSPVTVTSTKVCCGNFPMTKPPDTTVTARAGKPISRIPQASLRHCASRTSCPCIERTTRRIAYERGKRQFRRRSQLD